MMNAPLGTIAFGASFRGLLIVDVSTQALLVPQVHGGTTINKWWSLMQSAAGCPDRDHCRKCCWLSIGRLLEALGSVWHEGLCSSRSLVSRADQSIVSLKLPLVILGSKNQVHHNRPHRTVATMSPRGCPLRR